MKVLLIDDNKDIRDVVVYMLEREGIAVIECDCGFKGIEILKKGDVFDLVISDVQMPNGDGNFVMRGMTTLSLKIPLFLFSNDLALCLDRTYPHLENFYGKLDFNLMVDRIIRMKELMDSN